MSIQTHPIEVVVRAENITKVFGGTVALHNVDFNVYRGKVNAIVGENGAGKSTLMGVLAGVYEPTGGGIVMDGDVVRFRSPREAGAHGIRLIHQELLLFPNLSVAENIFAGHELTSLRGVRLREQEGSAAQLLQRLGQRLDPRTLVGDLPVGLQQMVAISKAISQDVRVLIMDEPTSALSAREVEALFTVLAELLRRDVSIVYISHRLEEVMRIGDYVTVLRDGQLAAERAVADVDAEWIIEEMVGRDRDALFVREPRPLGNTVLEVSELCVPRAGGGSFLEDVSFDVRASEIVGVYGLMGAGRTELLQCLIGARSQAHGSIRVNGEPIVGPIGDRIQQGLFLVPEDRQRDGLVSALSVKANISLASLDELSKLGSVSSGRELAHVDALAQEVGVKTASIDAPITSLSGGNQQKVVVARALMTGPKVLLLDDPMRGIDIGAKAELYRIMKRLAREGLAVLFTSSDLVEVIDMADRILVMAGGRITAEFAVAEASAQALVAASSPGRERTVA